MPDETPPVQPGMEKLKKDMATARDNAQLLTQQSNQLKEQADFWTSVHRRIAEAVNYYEVNDVRLGRVKKV